MKELERQLMVIAINEGQYSRISFLSSSDFVHDSYKALYTIAEERSGDAMGIYLHLVKSSLESFISLQTEPINATIYCNMERIAIKMVEERFRSVFAKLIDKLVIETDNDIERSLLEEYQLEIVKQDIFLLGDSVAEYLGRFASDYSISRIESYIGWRDNRVSQIKQVVNNYR
jgi:hypothetical protein